MLVKMPAHRRSRYMRFRAFTHMLAEALHEARPVRYHLASDDPAAYVAAAAWEATVYAVENHLAALDSKFNRRLFECDAGCQWLSESTVPRTRMTLVRSEGDTHGEEH